MSLKNRLLPNVVEYQFQNKTAQRPDDLVSVHQVHGTNILVLPSNEDAKSCQADGIITTTNIKIGIQTADCLPILFYAEGTRKVVAAVHAGWRGLAAGIVSVAVKEILMKCEGKSPVVHAAIGPSIRQCCFEVGPEVLAQFDDKFANGRYLALDQIAKNELIEKLHLSPEKVKVHNTCTYCGGDEWASYRRATHQKFQTKDRQWSWIKLVSS